MSKGKAGAHSIGVERESSLHRALKFRYAGEGGETEVAAGNFVCDARSPEGEYVEVQTGSFAPLKEKVKILAAENPVRIIHPIGIQKYIELYDPEGRLIHRRRSPRKGSPWDLFKSLLFAPLLPLTQNVTVEVVLADILEKRILDGTGSWRRRGARIADKILAAWRGSLVLAGPASYLRFFPFTEDESFGSADLGARAGISRGLAAKSLYVAVKLDLVERTGKRGNSIIYKKKRAPAGPPDVPNEAYHASDISSSSMPYSAKRSVTARRSSK
ncbi:MAG: hypothetical protein LBL43_04050 [Treponema sp.]|jgi:hypothetical protein|nr:hypothetical protein [Treponema sp.]